MVTWQFYDYIAALLMQQTSGSETAFVAVGSGDAAWDREVPQYNPTVGTLVAEIARRPLSDGTVTYLDDAGQTSRTPTRLVKLAVTFDSGMAEGTLREVGLFVSGDNTAGTGELVSYFMHPRIEKESDMILERAFTLSLSPATVAPGPVQTRFLGNANTREIHDLDNLTGACQVDEIRWDHRVYFASETHAQMFDYDVCAFCFGRDRSQR